MREVERLVHLVRAGAQVVGLQRVDRVEPEAGTAAAVPVVLVDPVRAGDVVPEGRVVGVEVNGVAVRLPVQDPVVTLDEEHAHGRLRVIAGDSLCCPTGFPYTSNATS
ncbi:hypothetical protein [Streptomyces sp. LN325]|uniref:hypothetical protein n=1 Tax=Streptomyces sp. LN325 TaxID=3112976 RepID=UPI003710EAB0